jgi:hypothetical protein
VSSRLGRASLEILFIAAYGSLALAQTPVTPIHRVLMEIYLGASLRQVQKTYPPVQSWPTTQEPNSGITRILVHRADTKLFPPGVDWISLEMLDGRVIKIKAIFDPHQTRKQPVAEVVKGLSELYGEPKRKRMTYGWQDSHTSIRIFDEMIPLPKSNGKSVELRTAIELADLDVREGRP